MKFQKSLAFALWFACLAVTPGCGSSDGAAPMGAMCGNGGVETGEDCDDGNQKSGDGCSGYCKTQVDVPVCGDGTKAPTEECDDGNTKDTDGCSADCTIEAVTSCGNSTINPGEECDDGNRKSGDGCSATCHQEGTVPVCGDGMTEGVEKCDDGNTNNGDGCSATCMEEIVPACGNGIRESGESCDDGNTADHDGCSAACQKEDTGPACGDHVIQAGEECDDGNTTSGDGCSISCKLELGTCGDGVINMGEGCDDGNLVVGDGCDAACHSEHPVCGNRKVETGEDCDDGNVAGCDGCSAGCVVEKCGNRVVQCDEKCDDGNGVDGDGCSAACALEGGVMPGCGNGIVETNETCDDGNTAKGDGCSDKCLVEATNDCQPDWALDCQDATADTWNTTLRGVTNNISSYPTCADWDESGPEYTYSFVATTRSRVEVRVLGELADLDIFVLADSDNACSPDNCIAYGDYSASFTTEPGKTYYVVVDGFSGAEGAFSIDLGCGSCGDGFADPGEQCDDGNADKGDGCDEACKLESCGDDKKDPAEGCDDGNNMSGDGCSVNCTVEECSNFVTDEGEECDDGNLEGGDGCSPTCKFEAAACLPSLELTCGEFAHYDTTAPDATANLDFYSCAPWREDGPEYTYTFVSPVTANVTASVNGLDADVDVFVLSSPEDMMCSSGNCLGYGNDKVTFDATAGKTYYVVVDGYGGAAGQFNIVVSCGGGKCGDGVVNAGEICDDGNTTKEDGCSDKCVAETCGDGVVQAGLGEECDDGNVDRGDDCSELCHTEVGRCQADLAFTACGMGDAWANDLPGSTNTIDAYGCAAGMDETGPEYTYEFTTDTDTTVTVELSDLSTDLDLFVIADAGDGKCEPKTGCIGYGDSKVTFAVTAGKRYFVVVDGNAGATSDYSLVLSCTTNPECGNGTVEAGEQCDDGNTDKDDGCSETCAIEAGSCQAKWRLFCGSSDNWNTSFANATRVVDAYGCSDAPEETGREYTYVFTAKADGKVEIALTPTFGTDLDVLVLRAGDDNVCVPGTCLAWGNDGASFDVKAGATYYVVVDSPTGEDGPFSISLACP